MLASEIFRRVVVGDTSTTIRGPGAVALVASDSGILVPADISCTNLDATDIDVGSVDVATLRATNALGLLDQPACYQLIGPEIDFTAAGDTVLIAPVAATLVTVQSLALWLTLVGGTRSATANLQIGSNVAVNDFAAATNVPAGILSQAVNTRVAPMLTAAVSPSAVVDLTTRGWVLRINTPVTGAAPVCKGRCIAMIQVKPN